MIRKTCQWVSKCISQKPLFWLLAQGKQACIAAWKTTTSIFRRIPRTSPLIQSKFSHCVESIFFSQDSRVSYLDFSPEARLPRTSWIDGESRPSSPFMGPFLYYSAMLNSVSDSESLTDSTSSSETAKRTRVRVDWSRDETNILLDC